MYATLYVNIYSTIHGDICPMGFIKDGRKQDIEKEAILTKTAREKKIEKAGIIACPLCGELLPKDSKYCTKCGEQLNMQNQDRN